MQAIALDRAIEQTFERFEIMRRWSDQRQRAPSCREFTAGEGNTPIVVQCIERENYF